ncbi:Uncharacterised protein [Candidatus Burarchaeum australiense]|nr:Uncharacterised protein [Candidatus Burarchaeum australiense]
MVKLSATAKEAIERGKIEVKVWRAGALQNVELIATRLPIGGANYLILSTPRMIDLAELVRIAEEIGLPISAGNGKVYPKGKGASDFVGL